MNSVLFVIETMMRIMREYPSLISRRGDIQVLPCASLRTGLTLKKNKEFSPGSKTKAQVLKTLCGLQAMRKGQKLTAGHS